MPSTSDDTLVDVFTFAGQEGEDIVIDMTSDDFHPRLHLVTESGDILIDDWNPEETNAARIAVTLPTSDTYQIWANARLPHEQGTYDLSLNMDEGPRLAEFPELTPGVLVIGALATESTVDEDGTYIDQYRFDGHAGERMVRVVVLMEADIFSPWVAVLDESDEVVAQGRDWFDDFKGSLSRGVALPNTGMYEVTAGTMELGDEGHFITRCISASSIRLTPSRRQRCISGRPSPTRLGTVARDH